MGIATAFFRFVGGFPLQVAIAISLILWAVMDSLSVNRYRGGRVDE
jgi:hypothetical protein